MTSRRTSHPRTTKQSDPIDKGKGKGKRPTEAAADSSEIGEALHKAKGDEERKVKLPLKRGENDKGEILGNIQITSRSVLPPLVHEFYASYRLLRSIATGLLKLGPCLEKVKVRGIEVDCSAKAINKAYFDEDNTDATEYWQS
ncbi:hypothetical protein HAX54_034354 [Datura stramonium]|uniref:Uncharacterized protein n=1 Tax=Datura stramonium TaxID=4076 RepID=A0ABS8VGZ4_DATST|nr:hypothetical protein [Datura stramonium]